MKFFNLLIPQSFLIKCGLIIITAITALVIITHYINVMGDSFDKLFGIPTKESLAKQVAESVKVIATEKQLNSNLTNTIVQDQKESVLVDVIMAQDKTSSTKILSVSKTIDIDRQQSIKNIEVIDKDKPELIMDNDISKIQITSIWKTYCSFNSNENCSSITKELKK